MKATEMAARAAMGASRIDIQKGKGVTSIPGVADLRRWARAALQRCEEPWELCIRIVDEAEIIDLNRQYRHLAGVTNVLSFPCAIADEEGRRLLGDIVICASQAEREAKSQDKPSQAHWAHLVIHGTLHLLEYDHENDTDGDVMEKLETELLAQLGFTDPYQSVI